MSIICKVYLKKELSYSFSTVNNILNLSCIKKKPLDFRIKVCKYWLICWLNCNLQFCLLQMTWDRRGKSSFSSPHCLRVLSKVKLKLTSMPNSGEIFSAANGSALAEERMRDGYTCSQRNRYFGFSSNPACKHSIWYHKSQVFLAWKIWLPCKPHAQFPHKSLTESAASLSTGLPFIQLLLCAVHSLSHWTQIVPNLSHNL